MKGGEEMQVKQKHGVRDVRDLRKTLQGRASALSNAAEARGLTESQDRDHRSILRTIDGAERYVYAQSLRGAVSGYDPDAELRRFATAELFRTLARKGDVRELPRELRAALNIGTGSQGGYTVPADFDNEVVLTQTDFAPIEALASFWESTQHGALTIAGATVEPSGAQITEGSAYGESEPTFAGYTETGFKYGELAKLSDELFQSASVDIVSLLATLATRGTQVAIDAAFATGNGTTAPQGLTANTTGITAASSTAITADEIKGLFFSVTPGYRANASWIMNDATLSYLTDISFTVTNGVTRPVVEFPDQDDPPNARPMILGRPVYSDMNWPTLATGNASVYFGSISDNYLVRRLETVVKVLTEIYDANGQLGFRFDRRVDGRIVDPNAARVLKQP